MRVRWVMVGGVRLSAELEGTREGMSVYMYKHASQSDAVVHTLHRRDGLYATL